MVKRLEESVSYCGNAAHIETSCWETADPSILIEPSEEVDSCGGDLTGVKTICWDARDGSGTVKGLEEIISYTTRTITKPP